MSGLKIYSASQHIGDEDFAWIARKLGHAVDIHSYSGHSHIMGREKHGMDYDVLDLHNFDYCKRWCDANKPLEKYDAFYCFYLPLQALLFQPFGKRVIMNCPVRYENPYSNNPSGWTECNKRLAGMFDAGKLTIVANSQYDVDYTQHYTGLPVRYIPSLCAYVGRGFDKPTQDYGWLLSAGSRESGLSSLDGVTRTNKLGPHSWQHLSNYVGTMFVPYNCSIMSFYEQYWLGLRIGVPSKAMLLKLYSTKSALEQIYWTGDRNGWDWEAHMNEMDWYNRTEYPDVEEYRNYREAVEMVQSDDSNRPARVLINEGREVRAMREWEEVLS